MSNEFTPDPDDQMLEKKSSQQRLLLLLLLLIGLFAYLYFFTGLIKPRDIQPKPETAQPAPEKLVKKPLPPRLEQKGAEPGTEAKTAATSKEPKAPATPAQQAKPAQTAQAPHPVAPAQVAPAAKPAAPAPVAKPAKPAAPAPQAKAEKAPAPAAAAPQVKPAKPATPAKEAKAAPEQKAAAAPAAGKHAAAKPAAEANVAKNGAAAEKSAAVKQKTAKVSAKPAAPAYTLEVNGDLLESETAPVLAKLKKAGISHVVKTKAQKGEPMHRLFLADFGNREEAIEELGRLKLAAPDAFMLKENGRYAVYAGSYLREGKAAVEQDRLYDKGVKLLLKSATAPVAVVKLRAGSYADQASAAKAAGSLKKAGLSAKVVKVDK